MWGNLVTLPNTYAKALLMEGSTCSYIQYTSLHLYSRVAVRCRYNAVTFLQNTYNRHPIARLLGRGMGRLLWVQSMIEVLLLSSKCRMWYRDKLDRVITVLNCIDRAFLNGICHKVDDCNFEIINYPFPQRNIHSMLCYATFIHNTYVSLCFAITKTISYFVQT